MLSGLKEKKAALLEALDFLRQKEISTVESLAPYLDKVSGAILSAKTDIKNWNAG